MPGVLPRNKVCRNGTVEGVVLSMRNFLAFLFTLAVFAVAPVAAPAQTSTVPGPAYRISPGDDLEIMVWGDDRLQRVVRVLPDGSFGFPLVGQVMAAGLLPSELQRVHYGGAPATIS